MPLFKSINNLFAHTTQSPVHASARCSCSATSSRCHCVVAFILIRHCIARPRRNDDDDVDRKICSANVRGLCASGGHDGGTTARDFTAVACAAINSNYGKHVCVPLRCRRCRRCRRAIKMSSRARRARAARLSTPRNRASSCSVIRPRLVCTHTHTHTQHARRGSVPGCTNKDKCKHVST